MNLKRKLSILTLSLMIGGCVATKPQADTLSIKPETALVTALVIGEVDAKDRKKLAEDVYRVADLVEKLVNQGVTLAEIKTYAINAISGDKEKAILSAVLDYVQSKYEVTVNITDAQKTEIVKSAIDGVKSSASIYLGK